MKRGKRYLELAPYIPALAMQANLSDFFIAQILIIEFGHLVKIINSSVFLLSPVN